MATSSIKMNTFLFHLVYLKIKSSVTDFLGKQKTIKMGHQKVIANYSIISDFFNYTHSFH